MWQLNHKEGWTPKNWCFWTVVLQKTLESPLDCNEIKAVNPKENQPWIFIGRTDAEAPILFPPEAKGRLIEKDPDVGELWGGKGVREDELVGWRHWLSGYEFEQTLGDSEGQGSLVCCFHGVTKSQTSLSNWTTTIWYSHKTINILLIFLSFNSNIWYIQMR